MSFQSVFRYTLIIPSQSSFETHTSGPVPAGIARQAARLRKDADDLLWSWSLPAPPAVPPTTRGGCGRAVAIFESCDRKHYFSAFWILTIKCCQWKKVNILAFPRWCFIDFMAFLCPQNGTPTASQLAFWIWDFSARCIDSAIQSRSASARHSSSS